VHRSSLPPGAAVSACSCVIVHAGLAERQIEQRPAGQRAARGQRRPEIGGDRQNIGCRDLGGGRLCAAFAGCQAVKALQ
jgi:hypothetical protein